MQIINLPKVPGVADHQPYARQKVYVRGADWRQPWTHIENLWCDRAAWQVQPELPQATLFWRFGAGIWNGQIVPFTQLTDVHRVFVKIVFAYDTPAERVWIGSIEQDNISPQGTETQYPGGTTPSGEQTLIAYSVEWLLESMVEIESALLTVDRTADYSKWARPFNHEYVDSNEKISLNNRSQARWGPGGIDNQDTSYLFDYDAGAQLWTLRDIVEYTWKQNPALLQSRKEHGMQWRVKDSELAKIPAIAAAHNLERHGHSVRSILNQIVSRQRLLTWWVEYNEEGGEEYLDLKIASLTDVDIPMLSGGIIPKNPNVYKINNANALDANASMSIISVDACDRVRVLGARREVVATLRWDGRDATHENLRELGYNLLVPAWTEEEEEDFLRGAQDQVGWPMDSEISDQRRFLADWRNRFDGTMQKIKTLPFDGVLQSYAGPNEQDYWYTEPSDETNIDLLRGQPSVSYADFDINSYPTVEFLDEFDLRISVGEDGLDLPITEWFLVRRTPRLYGWLPDSGTITGVESGRWYDMTQLGAMYWLKTDKWDDEQEKNWGVEIRLVENGQRLEFVVHGAAQHIISGWTGDKYELPIPDVDEIAHQMPLQDMLLTIAFKMNRYAEGIYPDVQSTVRPHKEVVIHAGDKYRKVMQMGVTAEGISWDGKLLLPEQPLSEFIIDDELDLRDIAKTAWYWYNRVRGSLNLRTIHSDSSANWQLGRWISEYVEGGDFSPEPPGSVEKGTSYAVNSVITYLEITCPRAQGDEPPEVSPVSFSVQTAFGELDYKNSL